MGKRGQVLEEHFIAELGLVQQLVIGNDEWRTSLHDTD